jgi:hypothetical protein
MKPAKTKGNTAKVPASTKGATYALQQVPNPASSPLVKAVEAKHRTVAIKPAYASSGGQANAPKIDQKRSTWMMPKAKSGSHF